MQSHVFFFHPDMSVTLADNLLKVAGTKFVLQSNLAGLVATIQNATWHPQFGVSMTNKVLEIQFESGSLEIEFKWTSI